MLDPSETTGILRRLPLFSSLSVAEIDALAGAASLRQAHAGERLFVRGEPCNSFHVLLKGCVKLLMSSAEGSERVIDILYSGQSFGEACMFLNKPYMVTAEAVEEAVLLRIPKRAVMGEIDRNPEFAKRMLAGLSQRLHRLIGDFEALTLQSAAQRVAHYLLRCADQEEADEDEIILSVSKGLVASRLNITREHFSRVLHGLAAEGLIAVNGKAIRLLDRDGLAHYAV